MKTYRIKRLFGLLAVTGFLGAAVGVFGGLANKTAAETPASTRRPSRPPMLRADVARLADVRPHSGAELRQSS